MPFSFYRDQSSWIFNEVFFLIHRTVGPSIDRELRINLSIDHPELSTVFKRKMEEERLVTQEFGRNLTREIVGNSVEENKNKLLLIVMQGSVRLVNFGSGQTFGF